MSSNSNVILAEYQLIAIPYSYTSSRPAIFECTSSSTREYEKNMTLHLVIVRTMHPHR